MLTKALATAALVAVLATTAAADEPKTLTETQRLRAAIYRLQVENADLRRRLADADLRALNTVGQALEAEFLHTVGAPAGASWDWSRDTAVAPPTPPPATPPKP